MIVDPGQDRDGLVRQALKVGYERLAGELDDGMGGLAVLTVLVGGPGDWSRATRRPPEQS